MRLPTLLSLLLAPGLAEAVDVAVLPLQRSSEIASDDALLLQDVLSGIVDSAPAHTLVTVQLSDLMAGRGPAYTLQAHLSQTDQGIELKVELRHRDQAATINTARRQAADLPTLASAVEDILPELFAGIEEEVGTPTAATPAAAPPAPSVVARASDDAERRWGPITAAGGAALMVAGGVLWLTSTEDLDTLHAAWETDPSEPNREAFNSARERQVQGRIISAVVTTVGVTLVGAGSYLTVVTNR
jgi:hypothetical protein